MIPVPHEAQPPATLDVFHKTSVRKKGGIAITRAANETARAIEHFTNPAHYAGNKKLVEGSFSFLVYKDSQVTEYLDEKFHKKCGYCESELAHVSPKDVDHYRPKASIEGPGYAHFPGYYWLGADWDNLVVACPRCNRGAGHTIPGAVGKHQLGKVSQFPLLSEGARVRGHTGELAKEDDHRLLLHPYFDQPEQHLAFGDDGLVRPLDQADGLPSEKARHSIEVYALQRSALVEKRKKTLDDFEFLICQAAHLIAMQSELKSVKARKENQAQMAVIFTKMTGFFGVKAPYQAMLRQYLGRNRASRRFVVLRGAGLDLMALLAI